MARRYDQRAQTYDRCWAPVLAPSALPLLDDVAAAMDRRGSRLMDAGTGTGTLAIAAAARYPDATIVAVDTSARMLERARAAAGVLDPAARDRITFVERAIEAAVGTDVAAMSCDAVVSSFVIQLVTDRSVALAALRTALRPGGLLALVTWADARKPDGPEEAWAAALREVVDELGVPYPVVPDPPRAGPIASPEAAVAELMAAGFVEVAARTDVLVRDFGRAGGRALLVEYDHAAELGGLPLDARGALLGRLDTRLAMLPDEAFAWRAPLVRATARRAAG